eukprot:6191302-Pleurochrysis_carterae.AAC.1
MVIASTIALLLDRTCRQQRELRKLDPQRLTQEALKCFALCCPPACYEAKDTNPATTQKLQSVSACGAHHRTTAIVALFSDAYGKCDT